MTTIVHMRRMFAQHGLPESLVTDNGTQFVSEEMETFLANNGIQHVQTPPKHPSSNGLAERAVQTVKAGLKKMQGSNLEHKLQKFLLTYRVTPQATTGKSPSELLFKRRIRTKLDLLQPDLKKKVKAKQAKMSEKVGSKARQFSVGDYVLVKNFSAGPVWLKGVVESLDSESIVQIKLADGRSVRRHVDQVRSRLEDSENNIEKCLDKTYVTLDQELDESFEEPQTSVVPDVQPGVEILDHSLNEQCAPVQHEVVPEVVSVVPRRSQRLRVAPSRLNDYVK